MITLVMAFAFLQEQAAPKSVVGCILIGAGTLLMALQKPGPVGGFPQKMGYGPVYFCAAL